MFALDVGTDVYNAVNYIQQGDPVWGWMMLAFIALPMLVLYVWGVIEDMKDNPWWKTLLLFLVCLPLSIILTPYYTLYVISAGARRVVQPDWTGEGVMDLNQAAGMRAMEMALESGPQSCLGKLLSLILTLITMIALYW